MSQTVSHVSDKVQRVTVRIAQQSVNSLYQHLYYVDVLPLVEASDVVGLGRPPRVEYQVDGAGVVLDVEPVAHVLALAVDRQRPAVAYVVDEQRYELLRKLVGSVVVGAVGDDGWHAVGVVEGAHEVVRRRL